MDDDGAFQKQRLIELNNKLLGVVRMLAAHAPDPAYIPPNAFADEPPAWATWPEMHMHGDVCGRCGAWCDIVRPGKTQCPVCGDDDLKALAIVAKNLLESE